MSEKLTKCPACWAVHPASNTYLHVCPVETSSGLRDRLAALTAERDRLRADLDVALATGHWVGQDEAWEKIQALTAERDEARKEREEAERKYRLAKAMVDSARTVLGSAAAEENARYYMERQRAEKAEAEIARLRGLVEAAFHDGWRAGAVRGHFGKDTIAKLTDDWDNSRAKRALEQGDNNAG